MSNSDTTIYVDLADAFAKSTSTKSTGTIEVLKLRAYMSDLFSSFYKTDSSGYNLFTLNQLGRPPENKKDGQVPDTFYVEECELDYGEGKSSHGIELFTGVGGGWSRNEMKIALAFHEETQTVEVISWQSPETKIYDMGFNSSLSLAQNASNVFDKIIDNEMEDYWCEYGFSTAFQHLKNHIVAESKPLPTRQLD